MEATGTHITETWVNGDQLFIAQGRLDYVAGIVARRMHEGKHIGPAFRVNLCGNLAALVSDEECRAVLEAIARHGEHVGVVVFVHATERDALWQLGASPALVAAYQAGVTFRPFTPTLPPGVVETGAGRAVEALLSAARLVVGQNPDDLKAAFARTLAGETLSARIAFAVALHATADMVRGEICK